MLRVSKRAAAKAAWLLACWKVSAISWSRPNRATATHKESRTRSTTIPSAKACPPCPWRCAVGELAMKRQCLETELELMADSPKRMSDRQNEEPAWPANTGETDWATHDACRHAPR